MVRMKLSRPIIRAHGRAIKRRAYEILSIVCAQLAAAVCGINAAPEGGVASALLEAGGRARGVRSNARHVVRNCGGEIVTKCHFTFPGTLSENGWRSLKQKSRKSINARNA